MRRVVLEDLHRVDQRHPVLARELAQEPVLVARRAAEHQTRIAVHGRPVVLPRGGEVAQSLRTPAETVLERHRRRCSVETRAIEVAGLRESGRALERKPLRYDVGDGTLCGRFDVRLDARDVRCHRRENRDQATRACRLDDLAQIVLGRGRAPLSPDQSAPSEREQHVAHDGGSLAEGVRNERPRGVAAGSERLVVPGHDQHDSRRRWIPVRQRPLEGDGLRIERRTALGDIDDPHWPPRHDAPEHVLQQTRHRDLRMERLAHHRGLADTIELEFAGVVTARVGIQHGAVCGLGGERDRQSAQHGESAATQPPLQADAPSARSDAGAARHVRSGTRSVMPIPSPRAPSRSRTSAGNTEAIRGGTPRP